SVQSGLRLPGLFTDGALVKGCCRLQRPKRAAQGQWLAGLSIQGLGKRPVAEIWGHE
ncbi:hypothetical protein P7K49_021850, partial [Saguinus oedipus]